jgi:cysteine-rich repeat protein
MRISNVSFLLAAGVVGGCLGSGTDRSAVNIDRLSGAIFTTLVDGSRVNANIYNHKEDVYLDGGPSSKAPAAAAALPEGDYYFQVTDPSGQTLLSTDDIECREFAVNRYGVISAVLGDCAHATGVDSDHASLGAITVQLMPYDNTPNMGGEYKVWVTPVEEYVNGGDSRFHGFLPSESKTDNYKVRIVIKPPPVCGDGTVNQDSETCDGEDYCREDCTFCGDSIKNDGEECDAGPNGSESCTKDCKLIPPPCVCGDNVVNQSTETCDGTDTPDGVTCRADCTYCGDGNVDASDGEECDDGNTVDGDGCSATCTKEVCPPSTDP